MIYKTDSPKTAHARIIFELPASLWADRVFVTGDFNQWSPTRTPLLQGRDGAWRAVLDLPEGQRYRFCYLINGRWHTDFHADGFATAAEGIPRRVINLGGTATMTRETDWA